MAEREFKPYVPEDRILPEFTMGALVVGLVMSVVLGAANAYLGLKAGMTIAATYPAAVIGMAVLRIWKGSILEENFARTVGSIGESVAAGAIFTIPAFLIAGVWKDFRGVDPYLKSFAVMLLGGILGILFVTLLRRVMVEDPELPFPESVAAGEIHKAGQRGGKGAALLLWAGVGGAIIQFLVGGMHLFKKAIEIPISLGRTTIEVLKGKELVQVGGGTVFQTPDVAPAYLGVGYIIGPKLAALNFCGGLLAWGLFVPLLTYFLGPSLRQYLPPPDGTGDLDWTTIAGQVWRTIVRPIAVGGMLMGAGFTLYRMRKNLVGGIGRAVSDVRKAATQRVEEKRTQKDLGFGVVLVGVVVCVALMVALYWWFSGQFGGSLVAALVMAVAGFFFAAVSGFLVGLIGSSNNPVSGLTLSTLLIAAILMVALGVTGEAGVATVLGVAAVVCVSSAVAGEMLQDLKVGHILGGTPWKMQVGDLIGVLAASALLYFPLYVLYVDGLKEVDTGFGGKSLPAPQAGLMAMMSQGIVGGKMAWPLVIVGMVMGLGMILVQVRSPMLVSVGMYLPLGTSFAIFVGGVIRWITEVAVKRNQLNEAQKVRVENAGVLVAAGLIAGEALCGLGLATFRFFEWPLPGWEEGHEPLGVLGLLLFLVLGWVLVKIPLKNAGRADEPAPPSAMM